MSVRRTGWIAAAIVLALASVAAAVGAVAAGDRDEALPERMQVPTPRVGDRAHYEVAQPIVDRSWLLVPYIVTGVDAEWLPPMQQVDAWGVERTVATLRLRADYRWHDGSYSSALHHEATFDTSTWEPVSHTNQEHFPERRETGSWVPGMDFNNNDVTVQAWFETEMLQVMRGPCGFLGALRTGVGQEPAALGGRCGRIQLNDSGSDVFTMAEAEEVAGVPTVRFDNVAHPRVHVWANPGIPFPVQVRDDFVDLFDAGKSGCCMQVWTLSAYEPGTQDYPPSQAQGQPTTLPLAASPDGLPDEAGTTHAFPASQALAVLRADPATSTWLDAHAGAYVGESHAFTTADEADRVYWHHKVILTDGRAWIAKEVFQAPVTDGAPTVDPMHITVPRPDPSALPDPTRQVRVVDWVVENLPADVTGLYPEPQQRPTELPRVAEALEAFLASANDTIRAKPVGWGAVNGCFGDCDAPLSYVRVNVVQDPVVAVSSLPDAIDPRAEANAALNVRADGTILSHAKRTASPPPGLLGLGGADPATVERASTAITPAAPGLPYAPIAVVAGSLALAALLAWLLWPAKAGAGAAGLFSRIEGPRLLEHPGRARIVQAIESEPGIHMRELARRAGMEAGALRHHLFKLEAAGLVVAKPLAGYVCYFAPTASRDAVALANASLRSDGARKVQEALQHGLTGVRAIAAHTGLSPSTVSHHLARLRHATGDAAAPQA